MKVCTTPQSEEEFQAYYFLRWQMLRKPWQQEQGSEKDEFEQQAIHRMCLDEDGNVVAVGRLHRSGQFSAEIRFMAVAEGQQGKGLGKQIIQELEQEARKLGITEISLNARENAVPFYTRLGYQNLGFSHWLFDTIRHDKMVKSLEAHGGHQVSLADELQSTWHQTIPMSRAMDIRVCFYDGREMITHCDPDFNKNLHHTMFAGSIYTLATLTGWGYVYMQLHEQGLDGDIVLAEGNIRYLAPIKGPAYAKTSTQMASGEVSPLRQGKRARFQVEVRVASGDKAAASFTGSYVVLPKSI
ncbi:bifunctional GNAT family N-acetyltransferase/hotdog fold thioesterase [Thalassomonas actiniarum]|uniref:YiiD C-terminal domain-containing protein n=1 Tax=Thalassomonas actiniarum TaxID=485447 RepID=A0AAE9YP36_9GAMM|nr:bifunctional GNAT family N-acetyltransferase/hotdog fold thioesterase [Thalassomonas actiniarum]WDD98415.1 YiiD C-terminal domain-containing protein [Thalassomonas actiniarum]